MLLKMVTGPLTAGLSAIRSNQGLLVFKKVQPIDPFIARFLFQLVTNALGSACFLYHCLLVRDGDVPGASL